MMNLDHVAVKQRNVCHLACSGTIDGKAVIALQLVLVVPANADEPRGGRRRTGRRIELRFRAVDSRKQAEQLPFAWIEPVLRARGRVQVLLDQELREDAAADQRLYNERGGFIRRGRPVVAKERE